MKVEEIHLALKKNQEVFQFAVGDDELNKIEQLWKEGQNVRSQVLKEAVSKINVFSREMVSLRVKMYNDMESFSKKYKDLIGESPDNTSQVKSWVNSIRKADAKIDELNSVTKLIQGVL